MAAEQAQRAVIGPDLGSHGSDAAAVDGRFRSMGPQGALTAATDLPFVPDRVLVIDHNSYNRRTIEKFIRWAGIEDIQTAAEGAEGLRLARAARPGLIVIGLDLGGMDAIAFCKALRATDGQASTPVLIHGLISSDELWVALIDAGGTDILTKPINPGECVARIKLHLQQHVLNAQIHAFQQRIRSELDVAREMQLALVPRQRIAALAERYGLAMDAELWPCDEVGGDYFDVQDAGPNRIVLLSADFSGHGIVAAINSFRLNALSAAMDYSVGGPAAWLQALNQQLHAVLRGPMRQFATALVGVLDPVARQFTFASAGAPPPLRVGANGGGATFLECRGLPLGITAKATYREHQVDLAPGDGLLLYSDCLTEAATKSGALVDDAGLVALAERYAGGSGFLRTLLAEFQAQTAQPLHDDLSAVWVEIP